ncbi:hypothetical protein [Amycolatopsis sp. SID8362]|uniref:hypothetical protein n=1 Tax=Amycolatopsis sp. SID8362 TaxID=2690346 RepID=UPI00136A3498|nr:hypothetical protein [Amycolatopsis sp. SID8362]NBH09474.1 hypothetical protein [Amycolatopsis sp. SID8362]NED46166.1 hypothetical protein [Amycolatopsis sp. SID8362]
MKFRLFGVLVLALAAGCAPGSGYGTIETASGASVRMPTATSTAPPAPREVPTETHTGKGSGEFETSWPADQMGFFTFDCPKCTSNVIIDSDGGEHGLVNAIGAYKGTTWLNTYEDRPTKRVTVHANAPWTATISDYRSLPMTAPGQESSGKGEAVLRLPEGVSRVRFAAKTRGNIALCIHAGEFRDLLLNQIGDVQVERDVRGPGFLKVDGYEASWTLTPS